MLTGCTEKLIDAYVRRSFVRPKLVMLTVFAVFMIMLVAVMALNKAEICELIRNGSVMSFLSGAGKEIVAKIVMLIFASVFSGLLVNYFSVRRSKILEGTVDHLFANGYALIVGYDFQTLDLVFRMLRQNGTTKVVVMSECPAMNIYSSLIPKLSIEDYSRFFVLHRDMTSIGSYQGFILTGATEIFIIGDEGVKGRDGKSMLALQVIAQKAAGETVVTGRLPVKTHLHIEDPTTYFRIRTSKLPLDGDSRFILDVFNYYESWVWQCWSNLKMPMDGRGYLPLRHRKGTSRTELFVIGSGNMACAVVDHAITLMNYGGERGDSRITTLRGADGRDVLLRDRTILAQLPEVEVVQSVLDGRSDAANALMLEAARRVDTSTTIVVAVDDPDEAVRTYLHFSPELVRHDVSILIWQRRDVKDCVDLGLMKLGGVEGRGDRTTVRYMGMTDSLPWLQFDRTASGAVLNYYYWMFCQEKERDYPVATEEEFVKVVRDVWDEKTANAKWLEVQRWRKWSCVCSVDALRERMTLFGDRSRTDTASVEAFLHAEHNRWWSERLLAGWRFDRVTDRSMLLHADMIPFSELPQKDKDKDKISFAAFIAVHQLDKGSC